jgi:hypothetical protein
MSGNTRFSFPPLVVAGGVAALVGAAVGGWQASEGLKNRRQEEALVKLQNVLSDSVRRAQSQAMRQFDTIATEYEKGVRDSLRKATTEVETELMTKLQAISEQRQRSRDEAKEKTAELRQMLDRTNGVLQVLARYNTPICE